MKAMHGSNFSNLQDLHSDSIRLISLDTSLDEYMHMYKRQSVALNDIVDVSAITVYSSMKASFNGRRASFNGNARLPNFLTCHAIQWTCTELKIDSFERCSRSKTR